MGKAAAVSAEPVANNGSDQRQQMDLGAAYSHSRDQLEKAIESHSTLIRTCKYPCDFENHPYTLVPGLLLMGLLVSLGAPFWNDILKGMMGVNNTLNASGRKTS